MKYLKHIKESLREFKEYDELVEFCETHLADLIDMNYNIILRKTEVHYNRERVLFILNKGGNKFKWSDICDYFIPFFEILLDRYELDKETKGGDNIRFLDIHDYIDYNIEEILNNDIEETELLKISFIINNKI